MANLELGGRSATALLTDLQSRGLRESEAAIVVSSWIFENFGRTKRTFGYARPLAAEDAACVASFVRTFSHTDWVDGESVVQAEETPTEEGFNRRFHHIEADLDALAASLAKAFLCMADMRKSVSAVLEELRAELNRLNSDVFDCCSTASTTGPTASLPKFAELGRAERFLGTTKVNDKMMGVYHTPDGIVILPAAAAVATDPVINERAKRAGYLDKFVHDTPEARAMFSGQPVEMKQFVERFGTASVGDDLKVADVIGTLPAESRFTTPDAMVEEVASREGSAIRSTPGVSGVSAVAAVTTSEGATPAAGGVVSGGAAVAHVADLPIASLTAIPAADREALIRSNIDTVGKLAAVETESTSATLRATGSTASAGNVAMWRGIARTVRGMG